MSNMTDKELKAQEPVAYLHEWTEYHPFGDTTVPEYFCGIYPTIQTGTFDSIKPLYTHAPDSAKEFK